MVRPWYARREVEIVLLAVLAGLAALGVSTIARLATDAVELETTPARAAATMPEPLEAYAPITARDIFNATAPAGARDDATARLVGIGFQGGEARAVLEDRATRRQDLVRVGDTVGSARVASIAWDHVVLATPRGDAVLDLAPPEAPRADAAPGDAAAPEPAPAAPAATIRQTSANAFIVDRRALSDGALDMSGLMTQLRAVAEVEDGRPAGFRLFQIKNDSVFRRLGLQDGDVVQRVNGQAITDPAALLTFLGRLRSEPRVAVDIVRGTGRRTLVYDLR